MSLTDALLFLAFIIANLACGCVAMYRYAQVSSILAQRHPEVWRGLQGYTFAARQAAGRFYAGGAAFRLNDPDLSRAVVRAWLATGVWIILIVAAFVLAVSRGA
jgi:hypothetical protein